MHLIQKRIFDLARTKNLASLKLREIGELVGEPHPQKIKHHINQLLKKGLLKENPERTVISPISPTSHNDLFISIPILGSANCGQATMVAEEYPEGFLQVSKSVIPSYKENQIFALKAIGNSMNRANISGNSLDDGDYAIVDKRLKDSYEGKYVLSIINGMANIKKLVQDDSNQQIVLISESTEDYPPIYISHSDFGSYLINGEVIQVIKKPKY